MATKKIPSTIPYYMAGLMFLYFALTMTFTDFTAIIAAFIMAALFFWLFFFLFPGKTVEVPDPPVPEPPPAEPKPFTTGDESADQTLAAIEESIGQFRALRTAIRNEKVSNQAGQLADLTGKILNCLKDEPAKIQQAHTFLNYYLPTTIKLLTAYRDLSAQQADGQNIRGTMEKIEKVMDSIVATFQKELDGLFLGKAMDIAAEIDIMDTMMHNEGFNIKNMAGDKE